MFFVHLFFPTVLCPLFFPTVMPKFLSCILIYSNVLVERKVRSVCVIYQKVWITLSKIFTLPKGE